MKGNGSNPTGKSPHAQETRTATDKKQEMQHISQSSGTTTTTTTSRTGSVRAWYEREYMQVLCLYLFVLTSLLFNLLSLWSLAVYYANSHVAFLAGIILIERAAQILYLVYTSDTSISVETQNQHIIHRLLFIDFYYFLTNIKAQQQQQSQQQLPQSTSQPQQQQPPQPPPAANPKSQSAAIQNTSQELNSTIQLIAAIRMQNVNAIVGGCLSLIMISHGISMVDAANPILVIACILHVCGLSFSNTTLYTTEFASREFQLLLAKNTTCVIAAFTYWALCSNITRNIFTIAHFFASLLLLLLIFVLSYKPNQTSTATSSQQSTAALSAGISTDPNHNNNNEQHQRKQVGMHNQMDQESHPMHDQQIIPHRLHENHLQQQHQQHEYEDVINQQTLENFSGQHSSGVHLNMKLHSNNNSSSATSSHGGVAMLLQNNKSNFFSGTSSAQDLVIRAYDQSSHSPHKMQHISRGNPNMQLETFGMIPESKNPSANDFGALHGVEEQPQSEIRGQSASMQQEQQQNPQFDEAARFLSENNIQQSIPVGMNGETITGGGAANAAPYQVAAQRVRNLPRVLNSGENNNQTPTDYQNNQNDAENNNAIVNLQSEPDQIPTTNRRRTNTKQESTNFDQQQQQRQMQAPQNHKHINNNKGADKYKFDEEDERLNNPDAIASPRYDSQNVAGGGAAAAASTASGAIRNQFFKSKSHSTNNNMLGTSNAYNFQQSLSSNIAILCVQFVVCSLLLQMNYVENITFQVRELQTAIAAFKAGNIIFMFIFDTAFNEFAFFGGFRVIAIIAAIYYLVVEFIQLTDFNWKDTLVYDAFVYFFAKPNKSIIIPPPPQQEEKKEPVELPKPVQVEIQQPEQIEKEEPQPEPEYIPPESPKVVIHETIAPQNQHYYLEDSNMNKENSFQKSYEQQEEQRKKESFHQENGDISQHRDASGYEQKYPVQDPDENHKENQDEENVEDDVQEGKRETVHDEQRFQE